MVTKIFSLLAVSALAISITYAGSGDKRKELRPNIMVEPERTSAEFVTRVGNGQVLESSSISWLIVDSMNNCYGMLSNRVTPLTYDPLSGYLGFIHRAHVDYGAGSGELWYNISMDDGATWTRVNAPLNAGNAILTRYPSASISNYPGAPLLLFTHASPLLDVSGSGFAHVLYGVDIFGTGAPFAIENLGDSTFWSNLTLWTEDDGPSVLWTTRRDSPNDDFYLWRTNDYVTITEGVPAQWATSTFASVVSVGLDVGGDYRNGTHYFTVWGDFAGDPVPPIDSNIGYSKSTDDGATWSDWIRPQPDWRIAGLSGYTMWNFGGAGVYSHEFLVDANDRVHFFLSIQDSITLERGIAEVYESSPGTWESKFITMDLKESTDLTYNALNQMGNHLNGAVSADGTVMALTWLDAAAAGDTVPDIWFSYRTITDNSWSTPENLTQTPNVLELLLQVAPRLKDEGGSNYTIFMMRAYDCTGAIPPNDLTCTHDLFGTYTFNTIVDVGEPPRAVPEAFHLGQNYPNPFNPSTSITYTIPTTTEVTLSVYDVLGQDVVTLVNEVKEAGTHTVSFSAENLTSGIYFYTIKAGQYIDTKRMVLMK